MEVIGRGSITVVDGSQSETDAWEVHGHRPLMISGVVLHSLPAGYRFDLRRRERVATPDPPRAARRRGRLQLAPAGSASHPAEEESRGRHRGPHRTRVALEARVAVARPRRPAAGPAPTLRILETRVLRGPNYWAREPVIRLLVDLGVLEEYPSNMLPDFTDALVALLPTLEDHACSLGRRGGFITRLREGTWAGHIAEHVALEFQNLAGTDVRHGKTRAAGHARPVQLHLRVPRGGGRPRGRPDGRRARQPPRRARRPGGLLRLRARARAAHPARRAAGVRAVHPGPHRRGGQPRHPVHPARPPLARPVRARRPPAADPGDDDLADVGDRRRRRVGQEPDQPAARLGRPAGPARRGRRHRGRRGRGREAARLSRAWSSRSTATTAAASTSTCAPRRRSGPRSTARSPRAAPATSSSRRYVAGNDYRCLVIGGKVAAIAERVPASVTGDGEHTVRELVDIANSDPRRGIGHEKVLTRIKVDEAAEALVRAQGFALDDVLPDGHLGQARPDRQHVDRRHVDRPDDRGPPRQRRDRRDGGPDRRARRRRHRLHLPGHRDARPRDRRRDRRGQRGARLPDAHPPDRGRAAVRRPAGHRFAVPGRARRRGSRSSP